MANNISSLISPEILKNLKSSTPLKTFGDQIIKQEGQKVISGIGNSTLAILLKEKEALIKEEIKLDLEYYGTSNIPEKQSFGSFKIIPLSSKLQVTPEFYEGLRQEWIKWYNPIPPITRPNDDRFDSFLYNYVTPKIPRTKNIQTGWLVTYDEGSDTEFIEGTKDRPPKRRKGWKDVVFKDNYLLGYDTDSTSIRIYTELIRQIVIEEKQKPLNLRKVNFPLG